MTTRIRPVVTLKLGQLIRKYRTRRALSMNDVADYLLISKQAVSSWEHGYTRPSSANLDRIMVLFELEYDDIQALWLEWGLPPPPST